MTAIAQAQPGFDCPGCGYSLTGLPGSQCPECGYATTEEERRLADRRWAFLETTTLSQWSANVWWVVPTAWLFMFGNSFAICALAPTLMVGAMLSGHFTGGWIIRRKFPLGYRRVARRLWRTTLVWLQLPWLLALWYLAVSVLLIHHYWIDDFVQASLYTVVPLLAAWIFVTAFAASTWRRRWTRLAIAAGLPAKLASPGHFKNAVRLALIPPLLLLGLPAIVYLLLLGLDRLWPGWWM